MQEAQELSQPRPALKRTPLPVLSAFFMIYIFVSGGSFGLEEMVSSSGPGLTLILLMALPFVWALPMALVASELGSALPGTGFYHWTRRALGRFWGFQAAWWWTLATLVDTSLYVVLAASYLQGYAGFGQDIFYLSCWSIIALFAVINILGLRFVALGSTVFSLLIISPFLVLIAVGLANWQFNPFEPIVPANQNLLGGDGALILGLSVGLWMYSGYESMSTLAGEIENPQKVIPKALMLALPFVALMYLLPTMASLAAFGQWERFGVAGMGDDVSFIDIGRTLGGSALGHALLASALLGNLALYLDYMGSCARPLYALADDGLFPRFLLGVSPRFGTPVAAILTVAAVNCVLVVGPFQSLVIIDVMLMIAAYALILIAAVRLRVTEPNLERSFRVPLGTIGMALMITPALLLIALVAYLAVVDRSMTIAGFSQLSLLGLSTGWYAIVSILGLVTGPLIYWLVTRGKPAVKA